MTPGSRRDEGAACTIRLASLAALLFLAAAAPTAAQRGSSPEPMPDLENREPRPSWMGIRGAPGVQVVEVVPDGPADRAGFVAGDLITGVDGRSTLEDGGLLAYLAEKMPGDTLRFELMREGEDLALKLTLAEFPMELWSPRETPPEPVAAPAVPSPPEAPELAGADLRWLGAEERPFLGLRLQELTPGLRSYFGLGETSPGLLVEHVHAAGPAEAAGLQAGDVLLGVDGRALRTMTELGELLRDRAVGEEVSLHWNHEGSERSAPATLAARKKDIWVVSPLEARPPAPAPAPREDRRLELEARHRALQEQLRRLQRELRAIELNLEAVGERD